MDPRDRPGRGGAPPPQLLHADDEPAQLAEPGGQIVSWVLRGDESYDLDHDVEAGRQIRSHPEPDAAV